MSGRCADREAIDRRQHIYYRMEQLARRAGLRWTDKNRQDIERAAQLLSEDAIAEDADTIPPYEPEPQQLETRQLETRVTQALDASLTDDDPNFQRWRQQRYSDAEQARRTLRREGR